MTCSSRNVARTLIDKESDAVPVLPPDWVVCESKRKKREYYFNKVTGETTWHQPFNGKVCHVTFYI